MSKPKTKNPNSKQTWLSKLKSSLILFNSYLIVIILIVLGIVLKLVSCEIESHSQYSKKNNLNSQPMTNFDFEKYLESEFQNVPQSSQEEEISEESEDFLSEWTEIEIEDENEEWSEIEDPYYEKELARLLKTNLPNKMTTKPSYLFSIPDMKTLIRTEAKIYDQVKEHVDNMEKKLGKLRNWMNDYEQSTLKGAAQFSNSADLESNESFYDLDISPQALNNIVSNPIIAHKIINRFSTELIDVLNTFKSNPVSDEVFVQNIDRIGSNIIYPSHEDHTQSLESLLRIQLYNNYSTKDLADGKLGHLHTNISLNSENAFDMAFHANSKGYIALTIQWLEISLKRFEEEGHTDMDFKTKIVMNLKEIVKNHDSYWTKLHKTNKHFFTKKINSDYGSHLPHRVIINDILKLESIQKRTVEEYGVDIQNNFRTLCSGKNLQTEEEKSKLYCWLGREQDPYWIINPLKIELLNKDPPLYQIYEILGPKAIRWLIKTATPEMTRSLVIDTKDHKKNEVSDVRTSAHAWMNEDLNYPMINKVIKKIELITGLNVKKMGASEDLQVASYGSSHHYDEHMDALVDEKRIQVHGDRIATFMLYLNDVTVGGKTAFPVMGTAASPIGGSAVFWYNLKRNSQPDKRTWHGGCPVVHGIKWVANKWILNHQNWDKRKCSLDPKE